MRERPRSLKALAAFLIAVAVALPVQIMLLYGHMPWEVHAIALKLAPVNWIVLALALMTAWLIFDASRWGLLTALLLASAVAYNNVLVAAAGTDYAPTTALSASLLFVGALGSGLLQRDAREAFLNPGQRWWRTRRRYRAQIPIRLKILASPKVREATGVWGAEPRGVPKEVRAKTFDLSTGGAFIPMSAPGALTVGTQCYLCLTLKDLHYLQCRAEVIRTAPAHGKYPDGIGLRFLGLSWQEQRMLQSYLEMEDQDGAHGANGGPGAASSSRMPRAA